MENQTVTETEIEGGTAGAEGGDDSVLESAIGKAQKQDEALPYKVTGSEPLPNALRAVTIEIDRVAWDARVAELFKEWQKEAAIEGFRRGKAPMKLLQRRFHNEAQGEILQKAVPPIVRDYEVSNGLTIYGAPAVADLQTEGTGPVVAKLHLEVKPDIAPEGYTGNSLEVPGMKVGEDAVEHRLHHLQHEAATYEEVDREYGEGLAVAVDMKVLDGKGQTVDQVSNQLVERPEQMLPPEVADAIKGKKAGDTVEARTTSTTKPGDSHRFTIVIRSVKELKLPAVDDEFAKDLGHDSLAALKKSLTDEEQKRADSINADEAFDTLMRQLAEKHEFDIPPTLQAHVEEDLVRTDYRFMHATGSRPRRAAGRSREEYRELIHQDAKTRVKGYLLVDAIGRKEKIEATEDDINAGLEERGQAEGRKGVAIRAALEKRREFGQFVEQIRFNKVRDFLLANNKVKYVDPPKEEATPKEEEPAAE